jgi:hypothetical protein
VASKNRGRFYSTAARESPQHNLDTQRHKGCAVPLFLLDTGFQTDAVA